MMRQWKPAKLRWLAAQEGGRRQVPLGSSDIWEYRPTARFFGDDPLKAFSIVIRFGKGDKPSTTELINVDIALLFPENNQENEDRFQRDYNLIILEGARHVAECQLMPIRRVEPCDALTG